MRDVGQWLRDADPLRDDGGLTPAEVQRMRRALLAAAAESRNIAAWWPHPMMIAATIALTLVVGVLIGRRLPARDVKEPNMAQASRSANAANGVRQLQFATAGGTRVIWVFNPDFQP